MALRRVRASARAGFEEATARWRRRPPHGASLDERELAKLRERIEACLDPRLSGVAVRTRAGEVAEVIAGLDRDGLRAFFTMLLASFGPRPEALTGPVAEVAAAVRAGTEPRLDAIQQLREACTPRWEALFELFCGLAGGVKLAVDLRAELLALLPGDPAFAPLDTTLHAVLSRLFPPGLLELRRITWNSPGSLLEKLMEYEAVHQITSWEDLKNRLDDSDRRCYAFIHPGMADEPLIFVEVALLPEMAADVVSLLDVSAPTGIREEATTAIFYSISACQPGLGGVNLGDVLIKEVVADLSRNLPQLTQFATLSPLPGFRRWLDRTLANPDSTLLTTDDNKAIAELTPDGASGPAALAAVLATPWPGDAVLSRGLREPLVGLAADYLLGEGHGRSQDRVANFHLTNGARVERLNWLANPSPAGLRESYGLMVNYRYDLPKIDAHHEQYVAHGEITRSSSIGRLVTGRRKSRAARAESP